MSAVNFDLLTDHELLAFLRDDDHRAYEVLYRRYFRVLFVYAYKKLKDQEQAKDMIQELFANLWVKRNKLDFTTNFSGYLFTAVNNKIVDCFLHKNVEEKYISAFTGFLNVEHIKADHYIREKQLAALIEKEIQLLPPKMLEIFELSRKEHLTHKEIAKKLSLSEKTIDRQVSNALLRLKTKLGLLAFLLFLMKY